MTSSTDDDDLPVRIQRALELPDAPPAAIQAAFRAWAARPAASWGASLQGVLAQVAATLSFDSWAGRALAAGLRGSTADVRHLLFTAGGRDIDVRIAPALGRYVVAGQVLGPDEDGLVVLTDAAAARATQPDDTLQANLDSLGSFRLENVLPGRYVMTLRVGAEVIALPAIDVGPREG